MSIEVQMATDGKTQGRLLWNDHRTAALFVLAVLVTVGIIAFQLGLRRGEFDPTLLRIHY